MNNNNSKTRNERHSPKKISNQPTKDSSPATSFPPDRADRTYFSQGIFSTLITPIQQALHDKGYTRPTPVQEKTIPTQLEGRDILGSAQTGTGKTAAFTLPILQKIAQSKKRTIPNRPRALIVSPTRELAAQIGDSISAYGRHLQVTRSVIFGGVKQHAQVRSLNRGKDIVVATPGRLLDLLNQGHIILDSIEIFVLDEADRMLDMGFLPDIKKIIAQLPKRRQSLFFSATLSKEIVQLAKTLVHDPIRVEIAPQQLAVEKIDQKVFFVQKKAKTKLLTTILKDSNMSRVLVFVQMKHQANRIAGKLSKSEIKANSIHGDKSQNARIRALEDFKSGRLRALVATDIAARGIDVDKITHVINYDLPHEPETYIHRIGRTARAGTGGEAISFCCAEERTFLNAIEKLIKKEIPAITDTSFHDEAARSATGADARPKPKKGNTNKKGKNNSSLEKKITYSSQRGKNRRRRSSR